MFSIWNCGSVFMEERTLDQEGWVHGIHLESRTQAVWDWSKRETQERKGRWSWLAPGKKMEWKQPDSSEEDVLTSSHPAVFSKCSCKANFSSYRNNCTYRIPKYFLQWPFLQSTAELASAAHQGTWSWKVVVSLSTRCLVILPTDLCKQEVYPVLTVIGFWAPGPRYPSPQPQWAPASPSDLAKTTAQRTALPRLQRSRKKQFLSTITEV